jgi:RNA recognition motif-containing protein
MTKVFVGNLHFQITDQALAEAFQDFKVKNGVVITRGRRSLGYGFVEFDSPELALEAIKSKNNSLINGRPVKVELASDNPPTRSAAERTERATWNPPTTTATSGDNPINAASGGNSGSAGNQQQGGPGRKRRRNNANRRRRNRPNGPPRASGSAGNNNNNNNPAGDSAQQPNINAPSGPGSNPANQGGAAGKGRTRRRTQNNPNNNEEPRVLSKTAVFVANLPFSVKDEDLKDFFKDNNAKTAHVVVTRNNRSRGYGFVDFDNEKDQKDAITTKNNAKFVSGTTDRVITVTPSYKTPEVTGAPEN